MGGQVGVYGPLTHNVARGQMDIGDITTGAVDTQAVNVGGRATDGTSQTQSGSG